MAIIVEQKRSSSLNILYIFIWIILIIFILVGLYYVFFKKPEIYEKLVPPSPQLNEIINLSSSIDPTSILQDKIFQSLRVYIDIPQDIPSGKENPFQ